MTRKLILASALAIFAVPAYFGLSNVTGEQASATPQSSYPQTGNKASQSTAFNAEDRDLLLTLLEPHRPFSGRDLKAEVSARFDQSWIAPSLEVINFVSSFEMRQHLISELEKETGQFFGRDVNRWFRWVWNQDYVDAAGYDDFKAEFYKEIDEDFARYFEGRAEQSRIRLDEVRWGGVLQDGIPPLRNPKMLDVKQAKFMGDDDIVFGIEVNGDVRAYPKRILAWHEMFTDTVGNVDVTGVYCTLCGTFILYDSVHAGVKHNLGTSGFLYRSNKLMYDAKTQSLWNTLKGEPVIGPLVGKDIQLDHRSVVTTTWGKWKKLHPNTKVVSLDTGYRRNYDEGVAYHDYFATDDLMFNTPYRDSRLANKQEVLALRFKGQFGTLAINTDFLDRNPVYMGKLDRQPFVVITDESGANRVYDPGDLKFVKRDISHVTDATGTKWKISEAKLIASDGRELKRLPYHRAFWFGWQAAFPETELIK